MVIHHVACDGWTRSLLSRALAVAYPAAASAAAAARGVRGGAAARAAAAAAVAALAGAGLVPRGTYADYAVRQRAWLESADCARHLDWWCAKLESAPPAQLPLDAPRPRERPAAGALVAAAVPAATVERLAALARAERVTLPTILLVAAEVRSLECFPAAPWRLRRTWASGPRKTRPRSATF